MKRAFLMTVIAFWATCGTLYAFLVKFEIESGTFGGSKEIAWVFLTIVVLGALLGLVEWLKIRGGRLAVLLAWYTTLLIAFAIGFLWYVAKETFGVIPIWVWLVQFTFAAVGGAYILEDFAELKKTGALGRSAKSTTTGK